MSPIQYQIDRAHAAIDACGELSYLNRVALLRSFDDAPSKTTLGWVRRASLAIVCARECASFWTPAAVASFELGPVLDFAQACLRERRMFSELSDVAENLDLNVEDVLALGPSHFTAAYAGYATVAAARTVIRDETLDESVSGELTLAVPLWGSAFWASCALAGGAVWEDDRDTDDGARRRFWLWYLDRAIPSVLSA